MATHSSILAWRVPGTGKPGGLQSMGSHRVGREWSDLAAAVAAEGMQFNLGTAYESQSDLHIYLVGFCFFDSILSPLTR